MQHVILTDKGHVYLFGTGTISEEQNLYSHLTSEIIQTKYGTLAKLNIEPVIYASINMQYNILSVVNRKTRTVFLYPSNRVAEHLREPVEIPEITDVTQVCDTFTNLLILDVHGSIYSHIMSPELWYTDEQSSINYDPEFLRRCRRKELNEIQAEKIVHFSSLPPIKCFVKKVCDLNMLTFDNKILRARWHDSRVNIEFYYVNEVRIKICDTPFPVESVNVSVDGSLVVLCENGKLYIEKGGYSAGDYFPWKVDKNNIEGSNFYPCPLDVTDINDPLYNGLGVLVYLNANRELCSIIAKEDWGCMLEEGAVFKEDRVSYEPYVTKVGSFDSCYQLSDTSNFLLTRGNELYFFDLYNEREDCHPVHLFPETEKLSFDYVNIPRQLNKSARR